MHDQLRKLGKLVLTPSLWRKYQIDGPKITSQLVSTLERRILGQNREMRKYDQHWKPGLNLVCSIPELDYDRIKLKYRLDTPADLVRLQIDHPEYFVRERV